MADEEHTVPNVFIQWKGTNACLDLHCVCGVDGHFDGMFAYYLRCNACGRTWRMHTRAVIESPANADDAQIVFESGEDAS